MSSEKSEKRNFLKHFVVIGSAVTVTPVLLAKTYMLSTAKKIDAAEASVNESLMREHGILRRIILIYRELISRHHSNQDVNPKLLNQAANIIRNFIEDYHEQLEEQYLFLRLEKIEEWAELIKILKIQHQTGRALTDQILNISSSENIQFHANDFVKPALAFIHLHEAHAAKEDTILFPAFQSIISRHVYRELGDQFAEEEKNRFGKEGLQEIIAQIATMEKELEIDAVCKEGMQLMIS